MPEGDVVEAEELDLEVVTPAVLVEEELELEEVTPAVAEEPAPEVPPPDVLGPDVLEPDVPVPEPALPALAVLEAALPLLLVLELLLPSAASLEPDVVEEVVPPVFVEAVLPAPGLALAAAAALFRAPESSSRNRLTSRCTWSGFTPCAVSCCDTWSRAPSTVWVSWGARSLPFCRPAESAELNADAMSLTPPGCPPWPSADHTLPRSSLRAVEWLLVAELLLVASVEADG